MGSSTIGFSDHNQPLEDRECISTKWDDELVLGVKKRQQLVAEYPAGVRDRWLPAHIVVGVSILLMHAISYLV